MKFYFLCALLFFLSSNLYSFSELKVVLTDFERMSVKADDDLFFFFFVISDLYWMKGNERIRFEDSKNPYGTHQGIKEEVIHEKAGIFLEKSRLAEVYFPSQLNKENVNVRVENGWRLMAGCRIKELRELKDGEMKVSPIKIVDIEIKILTLK